MIILAPALALALQNAPTPTAPTAASVCADAAHAEYDFFVGDWIVSDTASGVAVARSRIERIVAGCAIKESFDQAIGPNGKPFEYHGTSYTAYNPRDRRWRQFYVDTSAAAGVLEGGIVNGGMVLTTLFGPVLNRMTVAPQADGSVRQTAVISTDGGVTWGKPVYDFTYRAAP